jgi:hypothetical protein
VTSLYACLAHRLHFVLVVSINQKSAQQEKLLMQTLAQQLVSRPHLARQDSTLTMEHAGYALKSISAQVDLLNQPHAHPVCTPQMQMAIQAQAILLYLVHRNVYFHLFAMLDILEMQLDAGNVDQVLHALEEVMHQLLLRIIRPQRVKLTVICQATNV